MPAKSAAQQKAAGAALSAKRGKRSPSKLKGASRSMYKLMSERDLDEFASTKRKGKPEHSAKSRSKSVSSRSSTRKSRASHCSRTSTLSAAPAASVRVRRTKPGPSGVKNSARAPGLASSGIPFSITVKGGMPPAILTGRGSGASPERESSRVAPSGGNTMCRGLAKLAVAIL
jgi:hypothetical protein